MSKTITFPFKIPLSPGAIKRLANIFNVEIVEKVATPSPRPKKISPTSYVHTIPQKTIDAWAVERHRKDGVEYLKDTVGFHIKKHGRSGSIYFVDPSHRVCEFNYELSGADAYDILITPPGPLEWFLPGRELLSESDKAEIIAKLKQWLTDLEIRACLY